MTPEDYMAQFNVSDEALRRIKRYIDAKPFKIAQIVSNKKFSDPHKLDETEYYEMKRWLEDQTEGRWAKLFTSYANVCFELESDAVLFKLRWL